MKSAGCAFHGRGDTEGIRRAVVGGGGGGMQGSHLLTVEYQLWKARRGHCSWGGRREARETNLRGGCNMVTLSNHRGSGTHQKQTEKILSRGCVRGWRRGLWLQNDFSFGVS